MSIKYKFISRYALNYPVTIVYKSKFLRYFLHVLNKILSLFPKNIEINERIIERAFVLQNLDRKKLKILDVGCAESDLPIQLATIGYEVYGIDINEYPYTHPNFKFVKGDITNTKFPNNFFDCVTAVSTIEHIGVAAYGAKESESADILAIKEIHRILKPKGKLLITLPFGRNELIKGWYKVYDMKRLRELLSDFNIKKLEVYKKEKGNWIKTKIEKVKKRYSENNRRVVLILAEK
ncbi:MAG: class I SAM-dependent methyltransferase [Candidatus Aenigmatarchaeota archaeon]